MRILFVTSNRIGDAVLTTGLLGHLIRTYPDSRITVACGPAAAGLFERMPNLERLIVFEKQRYGGHWLGLWARTAGHAWDLVVDVRASALSYLVWARRRAVRRRHPGHKIAELAAMLRLDPPPVPMAWTAAADRAAAARLIPDGPPVIALGPTANWDGKLWPAERFVAFHRALAADGPLAGARAAVLAGPGARERALAEPVLAAIPGAIDLAGHLTLAEAAACLSRTALFIGNDSGLMHLAAATGIPTLGLFGPTPAAQYAPAGHRAAAVVADGSRMEDLSVSAAVDAARRLLSAGAKA